MKVYLAVLIVVLAGSSLLGAQGIQAEAVDSEASKSDYLIGIEDVLQIVVWNEPDLSLSVTVRPDGKITLPLANDIRVAGFSPQEVRNILVARLSKFIKQPNVTVIVEAINSFRVFVLGEVNQQGVHYFRRPTRLLHAIASAGGLTEYSKREVVLLREQDGVERRIKVNLKQLLAGDPEAKNFYLSPNDTILVF